MKGFYRKARNMFERKLTCDLRSGEYKGDDGCAEREREAIPG